MSYNLITILTTKVIADIIGNYCIEKNYKDIFTKKVLPFIYNYQHYPEERDIYFQHTYFRCKSLNISIEIRTLLGINSKEDENKFVLLGPMRFENNIYLYFLTFINKQTQEEEMLAIYINTIDIEEDYQQYTDCITKFRYCYDHSKCDKKFCKQIIETFSYNEYSLKQFTFYCDIKIESIHRILPNDLLIN